MATEVYNWVQKYDADLDGRQVRKQSHQQPNGIMSASGVKYLQCGNNVQSEIENGDIRMLSPGKHTGETYIFLL